MKPLNNRVIVKIDKTDTDKTKGGVALSTTLKARNKLKKNRGIITAIGKYINDEYEELKVGDEVLFAEHSGYEVEEDDNFLYRVIQDISIEVKLTKGK